MINAEVVAVTTHRQQKRVTSAMGYSSRLKLKIGAGEKQDSLNIKRNGKNVLPDNVVAKSGNRTVVARHFHLISRVTNRSRAAGP